MTTPITILLVEDDEGHARLIEKNLRRSGLSNEIVKKSDGQSALDYVFGTGTRQGAGMASPLLILLDLNMPGLSGLQVLERLKAEPRTQRIPIIILTTTDDRREVTRCYELGCNLYITKPVQYEKFAEAIRELGLFLTIVTVPDDC
jgi:CheY-like chemotaxis protein